MDITELLALGLQQQASDWHLCSGEVPMVRVHGHMRRLPGPVLDSNTLSNLLRPLMGTEQHQHCQAGLEVDWAQNIADLGRFRVHVFQQHTGLSATLRAISSHIRSLEELHAPPILAELALKPQGLILVTGPTGSGKSTTLAAMINHLNEQRASHIVTIEDPIEFIHPSKRSLVTQRELGTHTTSFAQALRAALRQDPDAILIGELRDLETIRWAITAAETGHLVFATLHTASAAQSIDRMVDVFPAGERSMVRTLIAEVLTAVVAQTLCSTRDQQSRMAAYEIMLGTPAMRHLIREHKTAQMYSLMQMSRQQGMQTLDQSLFEGVQKQRISLHEARQQAKIPDNFPA